MHRDTACEKVLNVVHLTPGTKHPASLYDSLPSDLQGNEEWSTCAPNCPNTQPPPNPYVSGSQAYTTLRVQELCESRSGRPGPGLSDLVSLTVSVDVKQHWSQFVRNMSTDIRGLEALHHHRRTPHSAQRHHLYTTA